MDAILTLSGLLDPYRHGMDMQARRTAFAERFNEALRKGGKGEMSGEELSKLLARTGVAVTGHTVTNWRNAKYMPRFEQFEGIAQMLGVDAGELAFGTPHAAEPRAGYGPRSEEQSILDAWALLGEAERDALRQLIQVMIRKEKRPGRRRAAKA